MVKVSALKVRVFQSCRLRFRYQYVDSAPKSIRPRLRPADTAGSLVHRVLADYYTKLSPEQRSEERLLDLFETGWRALSPGYHRVPGVDVHHGKSIVQLRNFIHCFESSTVPYLIEPHIQVEVAPGVTLFGRPDRIDENTDGSLHVIDYKGGSMPGDIDSGQLLFYALITELKYERRVTRTSFWYLDDGSLWTSEPSQADLQQARTELLATISTMNDTIDYLPTIAPHCAGCPFLHACEVRDEVARVREQEGW